MRKSSSESPIVKVWFVLILMLGLGAFQNCGVKLTSIDSSEGIGPTNGSDIQKNESSSTAQSPFESGLNKPKSLLTQNEFTNTQYVMNFDPFQKNKSYVIGRHMGSDIYQRPITDLMQPDLFSKTLISYDPIAGSYPHNSLIQTFLPNTIQHRNSEFGFVISTKDLKNLGRFVPINGGGPHWIIGKDFVPGYPTFSDLAKGIEFSVTAAVPSALYRDLNRNSLIKGDAGIGYSVGQLSFVFYFRHKTLNEFIVLVIGIYEPQGADAPTVMHDGQVSFVSAKLGLSTSEMYVKKLPSSGVYQDLPFRDKRFFGGRVGITEFHQAIRSINQFRAGRGESQLPVDSTQYGLESALMLFEVPNYVAGLAETEVAVYLKDFQVTEVRE